METLVPTTFLDGHLRRKVIGEPFSCGPVSGQSLGRSMHAWPA